MEAAQQSLALDDDKDLTSDGIQGFGKRVLRYSRISLKPTSGASKPLVAAFLKTDTGFRMGIPLRKYSSLFEAAWKACREQLALPFEIQIPTGSYPPPLSLTFRDLIKKQVAAVADEEFASVRDDIVAFADRQRVAGAKDADKYVDDVAMHFVEQVGQRIIRLLAVLEEPLKQNAYSAIESIYDIEADLTDAITISVIEQLLFFDMAIGLRYTPLVTVHRFGVHCVPITNLSPKKLPAGSLPIRPARH